MPGGSQQEAILGRVILFLLPLFPQRRHHQAQRRLGEAPGGGDAAAAAAQLRGQGPAGDVGAVHWRVDIPTCAALLLDIAWRFPTLRGGVAAVRRRGRGGGRHGEARGAVCRERPALALVACTGLPSVAGLPAVATAPGLAAGATDAPLRGPAWRLRMLAQALDVLIGDIVAPTDPPLVGTCERRPSGSARRPPAGLRQVGLTILFFSACGSSTAEARRSLRASLLRGGAGQAAQEAGPRRPKADVRRRAGTWARRRGHACLHPEHSSGRASSQPVCKGMADGAAHRKAARTRHGAE
mmetsp:Transcript_64796/g.186212  ORF Transcript_64796/g.186212 Transcript_64796/m.186212 type:complete len:297 (+) Transcript_64796:103-993(+)